MKIAIIADTHDNLATWRKATQWLKKEKIKLMIHCGDVCAPATLREISQDFSGKIYLVFGNVDGDEFTMSQKVSQGEIKNVELCGQLGELEIEGKKIAFTHRPEFARGLASEGKYNIVFYGHTHKPWEEKINSCRLVNPGNLAGMFFKSTFAVYDPEQDKLELKILEKI